jgi:hypothetical protein
MNRGTQTILSLTSKELRGALVKNGSVVRAESFAFDDETTWSESWEDGLRPFDQALRQFVSRVCTKRTGKITLIYQSPSAVVQFDGFDGQKQHAVQQSEAKVRDSVGIGACIDTRVIDNGNGAAKEHSCLTIADQDTTTRKLYAWMTRCGLNPDRMIPAGGVMVSQAIEQALIQPAETAVCYVGEESSVIAYAVDDAVRLVRSIEIGYRHLTDAYTGAFSNDSSSDEVRAMLEQSAGVSSLIWKHGVPVNGTGEFSGLIRKEVMPRIAPILQRYSVEIKQTFRFGVTENEVPARLMLCGPGSAIPHIGSAISQNSDLHIDLVAGNESYAPMKAFADGTLEGQFASSRSDVPGILPRIAREIKQTKSYNRAVAVGLALVMGIMGLEYSSLYLGSNQIRSEIASDAPLVAAIESEHALRMKTIEHATVVDEVATVFTENFGLRPQWSDAFQAVSTAMDKTIRIEQIQGDNIAGRATIGLTGLAVGREGADPGQMLNAFALELRAQDGIKEVQLGTTARRETNNGDPAVQFELLLVIHTDKAPFSEYTALAAETSTGGNP